MKSPVWTRAIKASADPQRARHFLDLLQAASPGSSLQSAPTEHARIIAALLSGSQFCANLLIAHADWVAQLAPESLAVGRNSAGLRREYSAWLEAHRGARELDSLREFKQREMLRIAARDLARLAGVFEIIREISDLADMCLETVWQICERELSSGRGHPYHQDAQGRWKPTAGCLIGLGKLGGQELNYSSDVDVIFVYGEEGSVFKESPGKASTPKPVITNHSYFNRLAEMLIAEVTRVTPACSLYRVDLRLRPEGDLGPLSRSISSYENYYSQWGQTWEQMMLIKARGVAGDVALAFEFMEMVQPFRYPRSINPGVFREVAAMKDRIENEVVRPGELERNVKLGRGGIREIEFIAQSQQLLHAGKQPFLQGNQTVPCLEKLAEYELLSSDDAAALSAAYPFLRNIEHRLQMDENLQTHTIPESDAARQRLARLMDFKAVKQFDAEHRAHRERVRNIFHRLLAAEQVGGAEQEAGFPRGFAGYEAAWKELLTKRGFRDPEKAFRVLREFVEGPGYVHVSSRTSELASQLLSRFFALCPGASGNGDAAPTTVLSDPDRVATRLDSFIVAYGARATLFELWARNPAIFELLVRLFDRSEFLAELAIRTPDLVDELVSSERLRQRKTAEETLSDLRHGLGDEDQHLWLRRYHQSELMRIGLRDILGLADFEQYLAELSALADACLQYALEVVLRKHRLKTSPLTIIGLGKLGGSEIDYGSDLDIIFVARSKTRNPAGLARLAVEVMNLFSERTEQGIVFHTDARLRPDGEKGLLVNTLAASETYYRQRAQLWEIQTLTRTRPIAGDPATGAQFQKIAGALTNFAQPERPVAAYTPDWKHKIDQMRMRIEKERTPRGQDELAIKTGSGGLMDAEFIAQSLCLENGWQEANTIRAIERGAETGALEDPNELIENYRKLRRVEGILRRWSYEGEIVLPDDPAPYHRVAVRCGFSTSEAFRQSLAEYRRAIREVYLQVFRKRGNSKV